MQPWLCLPSIGWSVGVVLVHNRPLKLTDVVIKLTKMMTVAPARIWYPIMMYKGSKLGGPSDASCIVSFELEQFSDSSSIVSCGNSCCFLQISPFTLLCIKVPFSKPDSYPVHDLLLRLLQLI